MLQEMHFRESLTERLDKSSKLLGKKHCSKIDLGVSEILTFYVPVTKVGENLLLESFVFKLPTLYFLCSLENS